MPTAAIYAKALREASVKDTANAKTLLTNLRAALERRGHQKLLPAILTEYEKLELAEERSKSRAEITPESERNRTLLELYRRLVSSN